MAPIEKHHSSPSSSGEETDDSNPRRRKWAPRVRTGCVTCRHRKVKCDEAKPRCEKCIKARRTCYYHFPGEGMALAVRPQGSSVSSSSISPTTDEAPLLPDMLHSDWHYVECIKFYHVVVLPHIEHNQLIPSMHYESLSAGDSSPCADSIIAYTLAARIKDISLQRGVGLIPSAAFGTAHLWDRFAFRVHKTLVEINSDMMLEASLGRNKIFNKIHALVGTELMLQSPGWKAHMSGFFALLRMCGGVNYMLRATRGNQVAIHDMVCSAAIANTVSPPSNNIGALWSLTKDEIMFIYKYMSHPGLNCPSELFSSLHDLTHLRLQADRGASVNEVIRPITRNIFTNISQFKPSEWTEFYFLPDVPQVTTLATIFQISVALYGLSTLPATNVPLPCGCRSKMELRDKLFELIKQLWNAPGCRYTLNWPIALLGFSLKEDASQADRDLVLVWLACLASDLTVTQPSTIEAKLRTFWASGLSQWEDCWQEPFVVIC